MVILDPHCKKCLRNSENRKNFKKTNANLLLSNLYFLWKSPRVLEMLQKILEVLKKSLFYRTVFLLANYLQKTPKKPGIGLKGLLSSEQCFCTHLVVPNWIFVIKIEIFASLRGSMISHLFNVVRLFWGNGGLFDSNCKNRLSFESALIGRVLIEDLS